MPISQKTKFYTINSPFALASDQRAGLPSAVLVAEGKGSGAGGQVLQNFDSMMVTPVRNTALGFDVLSADDVYVAVNSGIYTEGSKPGTVTPRFVWKLHSQLPHLTFAGIVGAAGVAVLVAGGLFVGATEAAMITWIVGQGVTLLVATSATATASVTVSALTAGAIAAGAVGTAVAAIGAITYKTYRATFSAYDKLEKPQSIRDDSKQDLAIDSNKDLSISGHPNDPTFFPIKIQCSWENEFRNSRNGLVSVGSNSTTINQEDVLKQSATSQNPYGMRSGDTNKITLDFIKPINIETIVKMIQMLDVELSTDASGKIVNKFARNPSPMAALATEQVFKPIGQMLWASIQNKTLKALDARLKPAGSFNPKRIDPKTGGPIFLDPLSGEESPNARGLGSTSINDDIVTIDTIIENVNPAVNRSIGTGPGERSLATINALRIDRVFLEGEKRILEGNRKKLQADVNFVVVANGDPQANINSSSTFGQFCSDYLNIVNTLEKAWLQQKKESGKKTSGVKKASTPKKKPGVNTTSNLAQLEEQRSAILSSNRILRVPGKKDAVFEKHADLNLALSLLDELRDEPVNAIKELQRSTLQKVDPAPVITQSQSEFEKTLAGLTSAELDKVDDGLKTSLDANAKKTVDIMQKLKRMVFSPSFLLAQAMTGIPSIFPLKFKAGQIEIPIVPVQSLQSLIGGGLAGLSGGVSAALGKQLPIAKVTGLLGQASSFADSGGSAASSILGGIESISSVVGYTPPINASFLVNPKTKKTYSSVVSTQISDLKNILENPVGSVLATESIQKQSTDALKKYSILLDDLQTAQDGNVKIITFRATIVKVRLENASKKQLASAQASLEAATNPARAKLDSAIKKASPSTDKPGLLSTAASKAGGALVDFAKKGNPETLGLSTSDSNTLISIRNAIPTDSSQA